ncbi:GNAT family N-acetyltransferase (plasmid) [Vibrio scophthalmi]|uniref:GNAT family N-acetyltransferase n=1 Tax=Vibrio scophthalmi TaxID=45658 RepID=UPI0008093E60|nr:GNAT family N-acetyltransferase [Vibrio scophthalmi]ANS88082.1 hypothetical protein VSVS12_04383 [Vibrio scophthalmi]ANS88207.1 hypothetical protein VSVS12_04509 [Vibrio scophthalmi]
MTEAKHFKQGDRVRVIDHDYPGLFKVVNPLNLQLDETTQQATLVVIIEPVNVDEFIKHFCSEALPADIKQFELLIKPECLELAVEPDIPMPIEMDSCLLDLWDEGEFATAITYGRSSIDERKRCYGLYQSDEQRDLPQMSERYFTHPNHTLFELWEGRELIGMLNMNISRTATTLYLSINAVLVINQAQGKGLGSRLAMTVSHFVDQWRQQQEWINKPEVVIHAELLSERGEGFLQQFAQRFDNPSHLTLVRDWGW